MKIRAFLIAVLFSPFILNAQYEQKMSLNFSAGGFKTFGDKYFEQEYTPSQMPNYGPGIFINAGIQNKIGEHFSLAAGLGLQTTGTWKYSTDGEDNWLYWSIDDTITGQVLESGMNSLNLRNVFFYLKPVYYLTPDQKWSPFFSAGISINLTHAEFGNIYWYALKKWGRLAPDDTEPWNDFLEKNTGVGLNPCFGVEYSPGGKMHFLAEAGYSLIFLNKKNFAYTERAENFNAFTFQISCRLNFIKSKEL